MGLLNISTIWSVQLQTKDRDPLENKEGMFKKFRIVPSWPLEGKAAAGFTRGAYTEYVSTEKWRPVCALARRSAPARRREAAPAKAGNAAGGFFQLTPN